MKKLVALIMIAVPFVFYAQDQDLDSRIKSLEESIDQLKRDQAQMAEPQLTQNLDWGNGWSWELDSGIEQGYGTVGAGLTTPLILKNFKMSLDAKLVAGGNYPDTIPSPDLYYTGYGIKADLRGIFTSPLYFNFTKLYGGLVVGFQHMWGYSNTVPENWPIPTTQFSMIPFNLVFGIELFTDPRRTVFLEYNPIFFGGGFPIGDIDWTFWQRAGFSSGSSPEYKVGIRFYLK